MDPIQVFLETLKQGGKQNHLNLTMIPFLAANGGKKRVRVNDKASRLRNKVLYARSAGGSAFSASWEERLKRWEIRIPVVDPAKREQLAGILSAQNGIWVVG